MKMPNDVHIDAGKFQMQLGKLAEVLAQKLKREAVKNLGYVALDLHVLIRQAIWTYNLLFYLNADERRETDTNWRDAYTIVTLPLVRNMIDCLFNTTLILQDPAVYGPRFRLGGFKKMQAAIEEDEKRYGGKPEWDAWLAKRRVNLDLGVRSSGLKMADVATAPLWPTLGYYAKLPGPGATSSPHQQFLKTFLLGQWREYSALAHATFEGLSDKAMFFMEDSIPIDERQKIGDAHPLVMSAHLARAAAVLLCTVTELQAYFRFDDNGARINERIHEVWNVLLPVLEIKELYDEHYQQLMADKGIDP
jgi:hypothetical protein